MTGAEETSLSPAQWARLGEPAPGARAPRRRLFRKYALIFVALVGAALLINSGFDFWFSYQENKTALVRVQQEKAESAAQRIAEFVEEIKSQIGWTTHAQWALGPLDQRRQDYVRLLRQVPAITELAQLDGAGKEQLKVSRLAMDVVGSEADFSQSPAFTEAKAHRTWFSPVYFRKESEPYMTLAMARDGRNAGVTVAEINLKLIWDVITALKIGQGGYAYVVDGRGRLIAHPDISLVLRDTDLSKLPQVAAALTPQPGQPAVTTADNLAGRSVLTAHAAIPQLGWRVFVEVPLSEAFAPLYGAAMRTLVLLAFGLIAATLVALVIARRMTGPIRTLQEGAARIGAGDLSRRIEIHTGDELEGLAQQFNHMASDLQKSYAELEQRVADRTAELSEALDQQTATAEVLGVINSSPGDLAPVFDEIVEKALKLCGADEGALRTFDGEVFHLVAAHGDPNDAERLRQLGPIPVRGFFEPIARGERVVHIPDVLESDTYRDYPGARERIEFRGIRTWLSVALRKEDALLGAIIVHRKKVRPFSDKQIALLQNFAAQAVIAMENARLITETQEALEQQTATAEVLGVINSSPGDLAPVFAAMLEKAARLCEFPLGILWTHDSGIFRPVAWHGAPPAYADFLAQASGFGPFPRETALGQMAAGEDVAQLDDVAAVDAYGPNNVAGRALVELAGARTVLCVALRKDDALLGVITGYRQEVRRFSDKQIALLQNFAAQAVIAMENARLITETREALEQQTATAEVLGVINSSPGDLAPVFDAMLDKALTLCEASFGGINTYDGERFHRAARRGETAGFQEFQRTFASPPSPASGVGRIARGERLVHIADIADDDAYRMRDPQRVATVELLGARTCVWIALRKDDQLLGVLYVYRKEVSPFSDKQIALLQNFAAQAVIAMENARLITETREALEQQTATAEVLGVINSSPGELVPVFDAVLDKAMRLCEAAFGTLLTYDGELFHAVAHRGVPAELVDSLREPGKATPGGAFARLVSGEAVVHLTDIADDDAYRQGLRGRVAMVDVGGARTVIWVALRKDDKLLGTLVIYRQEVRPFSDKQIALLQNFAAQAVIAMENARLITETREALEQQTATAEVLGVINSSPGDLAPVFEAILEKAHSLCGATFGSLQTYDGEFFRAVATRGLPAALVVRQPFRPDPSSVEERLVRGEDFVHVPDVTALGPLPDNPISHAAVEMVGLRTLLLLPLRKETALVGYIAAARSAAQPFTDREIALLQNFAAQAVIAMENARLITETREALEQQTATAEVLGVINSSPGDLAPVFDAMLEKAMRLCEAAFGFLTTYDGQEFKAAAQRGVPPTLAEYFAAGMDQPRPGDSHWRLLAGEDLVHNLDQMDEEAYRSGNPLRRAVVDLGGARTALVIALRKDNALLGAFTIYRKEVRAFSGKQIALLQNFAAQAVIAIENARLITETRERTRDLQESLEYQTATSDVLKIIASSPADLQPFFQAIADSAVRLCDALNSSVYRFDGELIHFLAESNFSAEAVEVTKRLFPVRPSRDSATARAIFDGAVAHIPDALRDPDYRTQQWARAIGGRSSLSVPMLREGRPIGTITVNKAEVGSFSARQIELLKTFADQAVIAVENVRLITELRSRTDELARSVEELKALAEVGQEVSSTLDLAAVLSTILNRSVGLTGADAGVVFRYSDAQRTFRLAEAVGWEPALVTQVREMRIDQTTTLMGEAVMRRAPAQIPDLRERPSNVLRDATLAAGYRSVLVVPLVGADQIFGALLLQRRRPGEFPEAELRLMQTLAAQSVLAIQNAGLFREIADKSEQLALASQHKSQFLANMSHELRTPLNAILGYSELLVDGIYGEVPERAMGVLERVQNNGKHLLALINDVLDLSKIEAGQLVLTLEDYALPDVVHSVVSAAEGLANTKGLKFSADIAAGLPTGHGDARRLSQVLLNLVGNAIKFTDQGEVAVGAMAEDGHFVLTVRDTGPGIAPEDHDKIFGEFQQVDNSNTRKKGGTGLGLAISKRMVEMQGGSIVVESKLGHGATFRVTLPIRVEHVADELAGELMGAA